MKIRKLFCFKLHDLPKLENKLILGTKKQDLPVCVQILTYFNILFIICLKSVLTKKTSLKTNDDANTFEMIERSNEDDQQKQIKNTNNNDIVIPVVSESTKISSLLTTNNNSSTNLSSYNLLNNNNQLNKSNASSKENDEDRVDDLNSLTPKILSLNDDENENNEEEVGCEEDESLSKISTAIKLNTRQNNNNNNIELKLSSPSATNLSNREVGVEVEEEREEEENEFELKSYEIIRTRFESDLIVCIVAFVFVFALHVSTIFTVLKPYYLMDVLFLLGVLVGLFTSYVMPHLRLENPW